MSFCLFDHDLELSYGVRRGSSPDVTGPAGWLSIERPRRPELPPRPKSSRLLPWLEVGDNLLSEPVLAARVLGESLIHEDTHQQEVSLAEVRKPEHLVSPETQVSLSDYVFRSEVEADFERYLRTQWRPWAESESNRRRLSRLYVQLLTLHQELSGPASDGQVELFLGVYLVVPAGSQNAVPLITHPVSISIVPDSGAILVSACPSGPRLELTAIPGMDKAIANEVERLANEYFSATETRFSPFESTAFEGAVRLALDNLASATESKGARALEPRPGWVLSTRSRIATPLVQDLERFATMLKADAAISLPPAIESLVTDPAASLPSEDLMSYRGLSTPGVSSATSKKDLYFPLPFNDEQLRVVRLLESREGVTVHGPPGTGKTHTIANIICHWLSHGRRVLVTSMKEPALAVIRDKLPQEIRPLALTLLSGAKDGSQAVDRAVETIATQVQSLDRTASASMILRLEASIDALHRHLARIDSKIEEIAQQQLTPIALDKEEIDPLDAALTVSTERIPLAWLPDALGSSSRFAPKFEESDLGSLFRARDSLGADLRYMGVRFPEPNSLPGPELILDAHRRLVRLALISGGDRASDTPVLSLVEKATHERLIAAELLIGEVRSMRAELSRTVMPWVAALSARTMSSPDSLQLSALSEICPEVIEVCGVHSRIAERAVSLPPGAEFDSDLAEAVRNLANGRKVFSFSTFFRPEARNRLAALTVEDRLPAGPADWFHISETLAFRGRWRGLISRWNGLALTLGVPALEADFRQGPVRAAAIASEVMRVKALSVAEDCLAREATRLFPGWSLARRLREEPAAIRGLERAIDHYLNAQQLAEVWQVRGFLSDLAVISVGGIFDDLRRFSEETLGNPNVEDKVLLDRWISLTAELRRLHALGPEFAVVATVTAAIENSGADKLASLLRQPSDLPRERLIPNSWRAGWRLRRLETHLESIRAGARVTDLSAERAAAEHDLSVAYRNLVVWRSWLRLAEVMTPGVRAALQAYLGAVHKLGKAVGKQAAQHRRDAREAAELAQAAVPCWIMPHHMVSESLPSHLGAFDLVVVDEASQSDLTGFPSLLRGRKFLIVGDDKQVSPDTANLEGEDVRHMLQTRLPSQVPIYRMQLSPDRSLYDLAQVVFAANSVMLKEHFRCVAPIIEYSRREFYGNELRPLRLPVQSSRLEPSLIDVMINGASRVGDVNPAEADYIVDEIRRIHGDQNLRDRSIGVISLLGTEQATRIFDLIADRIGPEVLQQHSIACGDARAFQGLERDIVFLSMVVAPNSIDTPLSQDIFAQRLNVAASRARDRMILVRSVDTEHLAESDQLRRGLIEHFREPFARPFTAPPASRDRCESMLERALFDWLTGKGYRVTPHAAVGCWWVDLLVEGVGDARLAIECDGDRRTGPACWVDDLRRQRVLERAGWSFWRCFASRFILEQDVVLAELATVLARHRIQPGPLPDTREDTVTAYRRVQAEKPIPGLALL